MPCSNPLAREFVLKDGQKLKTLRNAASLFVERFESFKGAPELQRANELLVQAASAAGLAISRHDRPAAEEDDGVIAHIDDLMGGGTRNRSCRCHPFLQRMVCRH